MDGLVFLIPVAGITMLGFVLTPLARALARRMERGASVDSGEVEALREELAHWRARVEEMERTVVRLDELEERVDFAERLLVKGREREALPGE
ncbi:MAG TPA: hypothetical protein VD793_04275 [Gemmatimonadales bacterium]|nr:hypothetical protein [Gemmatimonadales bacterium]